jgi:tetratricopeptide (TPR) repeat protein
MAENERASEYITRAFQLRDHASEREKLIIAGMYYYAVTGELDNTAQMFQKITESYPRDAAPYTYLGLAYARQGQYEKTVETYLREYPLAGDNLDFYLGLARFYLALQRLDETQKVLQELQTRKLDSGGVHYLRYNLAFVAGDSHAMAEQLAWLQSTGKEALGLQSKTEAYSGHLGKARELTSRAVDSALREDDKEDAARLRANAAVREAALGNPAQSRQAAAEALRIAPASQGVEIESALAFAMVGDKGRAESLSQDLGKRFPLDTQVQSVWLPTIAAR